MSTTLSDLVLQFIAREQAELFTAIPATIVDISSLESENIVSVQPAINDPNSVTLPILEDVPVVWPSGGGAVITFPLAVGDDVLIVFSMKSNVEFQLSNQDTVDPFDERIHNISDGYCMVGVFRNQKHPSPNPTDFEIKYKGSEITIKENGDVEIETENALLQIETGGNVTITNNNAAVTILDTGDITLSNNVATIEALNSGAIDISNASGNITMAVNGDIDLNGATIDAATGNVVTASGADLDALLLAYNAHKHNAGLLFDSVPLPVTGVTAITDSPA